MYLPDRSGTDRLIAELPVDLIDLLSRLRLDHRAGDLRIQFFHILAERLQFFTVTFRQEIRAAGHDLSDLDVSRAKILQGCPQFHGSEPVRVEIMLRQHADHLGGTFCILLIFLQRIRKELFQIRRNLHRRMRKIRFRGGQFPLELILARNRSRVLVFLCLCMRILFYLNAFFRQIFFLLSFTHLGTLLTFSESARPESVLRYQPRLRKA